MGAKNSTKVSNTIAFQGEKSQNIKEREMLSKNYI